MNTCTFSLSFKSIEGVHHGRRGHFVSLFFVFLFFFKQSFIFRVPLPDQAVMFQILSWFVAAALKTWCHPAFQLVGLKSPVSFAFFFSFMNVTFS